MFHRFCHEAEYYPTLSRLPLHMRMKLDLIGVKISLKDWLSISFAERTVLCHLPCASDEEKAVLTAYLDFLSQKYRGVPVQMTEIMRQRTLREQSLVPEPVRGKKRRRRASSRRTNGLAGHRISAMLCTKRRSQKASSEAFADVLDELRQTKKTCDRNLTTHAPPLNPTIPLLSRLDGLRLGRSDQAETLPRDARRSLGKPQRTAPTPGIFSITACATAARSARTVCAITCSIGVHLCMTRLKLLKLNTTGARSTCRVMNDVSRLRSMEPEQAALAGPPVHPDDSPPRAHGVFTRVLATTH